MSDSMLKFAGFASSHVVAKRYALHSHRHRPAPHLYALISQKQLCTRCTDKGENQRRASPFSALLLQSCSRPSFAPPFSMCTNGAKSVGNFELAPAERACLCKTNVRLFLPLVPGPHFERSVRDLCITQKQGG